MRYKIWGLLTLLIYSFSMNGQLDFSSNKGSLELDFFIALKNKDKLEGYVSKVTIEHKSEKKNIISFLNPDADELFKLEFEKSNFSLLEASVNDSTLALLFINSLERKIKINLYNYLGQELKEHNFSISNSENYYFINHNYFQNLATDKNRFLLPADSSGFYLLSVRNQDTSYQALIRSIDSSSDVKSYTYSAKSKLEEVRILGNSKSNIYLSVMRSGKESNSYTTDIVAFNASSFSSQYQLSQEGQMDYQFYPTKLISNKQTDSIQLIGYYFSVKQNMFDHFYDGFASWYMEPNGDVWEEVYHNFQKDFPSFNFKNDNQSKEFGFLFLHDVLVVDDKIYLVTEGYKKVTDGSAIGYSVMGMGYIGSYTTIKSNEIFLFEFSSNFELIKHKKLEKKNNAMQLNIDNLPVFVLGKLFHQYGLFDYMYSEKLDSNYFLVYRNYNRESKGSSSYIFDKYDLFNPLVEPTKIYKQPNTSFTNFFPNYNGSLMIVETIKKKIYFDFKH